MTLPSKSHHHFSQVREVQELVIMRGFTRSGLPQGWLAKAEPKGYRFITDTAVQLIGRNKADAYLQQAGGSEQDRKLVAEFNNNSGERGERARLPNLAPIIAPSVKPGAQARLELVGGGALPSSGLENEGGWQLEKAHGSEWEGDQRAQVVPQLYGGPGIPRGQGGGGEDQFIFSPLFSFLKFTHSPRLFIFSSIIFLKFTPRPCRCDQRCLCTGGRGWERPEQKLKQLASNYEASPFPNSPVQPPIPSSTMPSNPMSSAPLMSTPMAPSSTPMSSTSSPMTSTSTPMTSNPMLMAQPPAGQHHRNAGFLNFISSQN